MMFTSKSRCMTLDIQRKQTHDQTKAWRVENHSLSQRCFAQLITTGTIDNALANSAAHEDDFNLTAPKLGKPRLPHLFLITFQQATIWQHSLISRMGAT